MTARALTTPRYGCDECGKRYSEKQAKAAMRNGCAAGCSGVDIHEILDEPAPPVIDLMEALKASLAEEHGRLHAVSQGVTDSDLLRDQRRAEARVLAEGNAPECPHPQLQVARSISSTFDDHETAAGYCRDCDSFVLVTSFHDGRFESRPLTAVELEQFARECVR